MTLRREKSEIEGIVTQKSRRQMRLWEGGRMVRLTPKHIPNRGIQRMS